MSTAHRPSTTARLAGIGVVLLAGLSAVWAWKSGEVKAAAARPTPTTDEVPRFANGILKIPAATAKSMKLATAAISPVTAPTQLRLTGQLTLDPNRLIHVTARFGGEVISVAEGPKPGVDLTVGQTIEKGKLMAVIWSREIGEKKSDLVDALSQLYLHQAIYKRLKESTPGAVAQRSIDEMLRSYEADLIQVERLRRTLKSWRISQEELHEIEAEAQRIHAKALEEPKDQSQGAVAPSADNWANFEIRSPITGTILERNLTVGDIVGPDLDIFKVADLSQLIVMANVYEDDLPQLLKLAPEHRNWKITVSSNPSVAPIEKSIDIVGNVIDPNQHTAIVQGSIDNHDGQLRVGQFIEAVIDIPSAGQGWQVPLAALLDTGETTHVLVATEKDFTGWRPQEIRVKRRTSSMAWIEPVQGDLHAGEELITNGGLELLNVIQDQAPAANESHPQRKN